MKSLLNFLQLVYPPISNQAAEWLWKDAEVRKFVRRSKLYMLAQRKEVLFENYSVDLDSMEFRFSFKMGDVLQEGLVVPLDQLTKCSDQEVEIEAGPRMLRIWRSINGQRSQVPLFWATTDKLLYDVWRGRYQVSGGLDVRIFTKYFLYYVGISKSQDSFSRLFKNGHKNRTRILSNETQLTPTARLTDELYIFFCDVEELQIAQYEINDEIELPVKTPKEWLIADAEKALVKILDSKYNEVKYENYPAGTDGLHGKGFTRYGYIIDEDIELVTSRRSLRGVHNYLGSQAVHPDFIFTEGDHVEVLDHSESAAYTKNA